MCGIAGLVSPERDPASRTEVLGRMCTAMQHRGPDDGGIESRGAATIGMRRLAIFDPANGHQPIATPGGRYHLVFNGAIYNFRRLRHELADLGYPFRTECDTEVLLAAYAQWGESCLHRLRGMFAFAVWDAREESLFLARDAFGIKPVYYCQRGADFLFASELNALISSGLVPAELEPGAVADYLGWFAVPAPRTIYRDVLSLRPGECAQFQRGRLRVWSAWSFRLPATQPPPCRTRDEFRDELRVRLEDTIRAHVLADVPVGAFLSGGLDSAVIAGLMTRATNSPLKTFSIGFEHAGFDETKAAEATARHFEAEHQTRILTGREVAADLPALMASYDQPTGDGINTYYASQTARAGGVTVALSGLGGDELFGGYPSFQDVPRLSRWLPYWRRLPATVRGRIVTQLHRQGARSRKLADILEHARSVHELCALQRRVFSNDARLDLLNPDVRAATADVAGFHPQLDALAGDLADDSLFEVISAWELRTYMADVLLRDSDVMSMRHSLELRVPFVDRPFVEWLWRQPAAFKEDRQHPKSALANAVADLLPPGMAGRRKWGFVLPFANWMRAELRPFLDETFAPASIERSGFFARDQVQACWGRYLQGRDSRQWSRVWSLAVLIQFANRPTLRPAPVRPPVVTLATPRLPRVDEPTTRPARRARRHRTLLLAPELFASEGGIPRILQLYLHALCELAEPGDAVRFIALNDQTVDSADLRRMANDRLTDWRVCNRDKSRFVRATLQLSRGCDRLVCGHVAQLPVALLAKMLNRHLRYFLVAHGIEVWRPLTMAERMALRGAARIFCVSAFTRGELLRRCPLDERKVVVLPNALDPAFAIGPGVPRAEVAPVILTVSRVTKADRYKGVEHMVEAMPAIRAQLPNARLRVIGRGDDVPRLQALAANLGMQGAVEFLGYVPDAEMIDELRRCALFALPSKKEGFGLVFVEAMAHGRPCLGARAGGVPEVISEDAGVLVEFGNVPALAAACVDALRRDWDEPAILARARTFSYPYFKGRLASLLEEGTASSA